MKLFRVVEVTGYDEDCCQAYQFFMVQKRHLLINWLNVKSYNNEHEALGHARRGNSTRDKGIITRVIKGK